MIWLFLGTLFLLLFLGLPVAFSMLTSAVVLMLAMGTFDTQVLAENLIRGSNNFSLMAIPFFILTGEIMSAGGMSRRIIDFATSLVGHIRGGLGYVVIISGVIFAGLSGSAVADTAALGAILIPMMIAKGYGANSSSGLVASSGIVGTIIPPSIPMILFGVVGGVSITQLFMSGIVPGLLMATGLCAAWYFVCRRDESARMPKMGWAERRRAFVRAVGALLLPLIIIVGLRGGVMTPTEAGVVAAVYAGVVSFAYRELAFARLAPVFLSSVRTTGLVLFLAAAAIVTSYVITVARIPAELGAFLTGITDNPTLLLLVIMAFMLVVGCVMDLTPAILIFTPVLLPAVVLVGIDPVYFGLLLVINLSIGLITPPVGTVLYVACGISGISLWDIVKGVWPFWLVQVSLLLLLVLVPQIVMVPLEFLTG